MGARGTAARDERETHGGSSGTVPSGGLAAGLPAAAASLA